MQKTDIRIENWNGHPIRFVERDGEWWAVAIDFEAALEMTNINKVLADFPKDEKAEVTISYLSSNGVSQRRKVSVLSELGIYRLIFQSRMPEAETFRKWVFDIIKKLRSALGYEQYQSLLFAQSVENHHINMDKLKEMLNPETKIPYYKAHSVADKAVSNLIGLQKMIKKNDIKEKYPEMIPIRDKILTDTVELMALNERFNLGLSVSEQVYQRYCTPSESKAVVV
jgi:prophage antirepressor-like protein